MRLSRTKNRRDKNDDTDHGNRERYHRRRKNGATFHDDAHIGTDASIAEIPLEENIVTDW
jgi:hypothetical protein